MDVSSAKWLSELGMDGFDVIHQCHMDAVEFNSIQDIMAAAGQNLKRSFSSESYSSYPILPTKHTTTTFRGCSNENPQSIIERPNKLLKTNSWNSSTITEYVSPKHSSQTCHMLSFENSNSQPENPKQFYGNLDCSLKRKVESASSPENTDFPPLISRVTLGSNNYAIEGNYSTARYSSMTRTPALAQDHTMAERKRREKLTQRFIALSALLPSLKKMDKASVLGDAIRYVKELRERVKVLEEQTKKRTVEAVIFVKKSQVSADDDQSSSCDENSERTLDASRLEIEARATEKDVLIRIHCEKQKGFLPKITREVEMLRLSIIGSSVIPFGNSTFDITIIAQKNSEFSMTIKDVVRELRSALLKLM